MKLKQHLAIVLAVMVLPSAAMAFDGPPDEVLSVTVDLPADGGEIGPEGCSGYSSMSLSANNLAATLDEISPAIAEPTFAQRLALYGLTPNTQDSDRNPLFTLEEGDAADGSDRLSISSVVISSVVGWDYAISKLDTNGDGFIDNEDLSLLNLDRRVFVTDEFDVVFDASTCVNSSFMGRVEASRTDVEMSVMDDEGDNRFWRSVEADLSDPGSLQDIETFAGEAYLATTVRIGPINVLRRLLQGSEDGDQPILFGSDGTRSFRAVTRLFGEGNSGQFRTQYYFWLTVSDSNGLFGDNGPNFGP